MSRFNSRSNQWKDTVHDNSTNRASVSFKWVRKMWVRFQHRHCLNITLEPNINRDNLKPIPVQIETLIQKTDTTEKMPKILWFRKIKLIYITPNKYINGIPRHLPWKSTWEVNRAVSDNWIIGIFIQNTENIFYINKLM